MPVSELKSGGCQCGAVRFSAHVLPETAHICHCRMCQKAAGNLFATLVSAQKRSFVWTRGAPKVFLSSDHVQRGFCGDCGTPLFYNDVSGDSYGVSIAAFDVPEIFPPQTQDGIEGRISWFSDLSNLPEKGETGAGDEADWADAIQKSNNQHPDHDTKSWPSAQAKA